MFSPFIIRTNQVPLSPKLPAYLRFAIDAHLTEMQKNPHKSLSVLSSIAEKINIH